MSAATATKRRRRSKPSQGFTRPLYIRAVPEAIWLRVHDNANRSRLRLQDYVATVLQSCEPLAVPAESTEVQPCEPK